jgi:hypothetical protein
MKMKNIVFALSAFAMLGLVAADYVQTTFFFAVPSTNTFSVTWLDGGSNNSASAYPPTNVGSVYWFNSSTGNSQMVQPCIGAIAYSSSSVVCQNGASLRPFAYITNTGTVTSAYYMEWNATLPTGVTTCANGSKRDSSGSHTVNAEPCITTRLGSASAAGNLNNSAWYALASGVTPTAPNNAVNVTIYANFSGVSGGVTGVGLYMNSTP